MPLVLILSSFFSPLQHVGCLCVLRCHLPRHPFITYTAFFFPESVRTTPANAHYLLTSTPSIIIGWGEVVCCALLRRGYFLGVLTI